MPFTELMWWGYLHQNGSIHVKRWFGDHADYTTDCEGNEFVARVVKPFEAADSEAARIHIRWMLQSVYDRLRECIEEPERYTSRTIFASEIWEGVETEVNKVVHDAVIGITQFDVGIVKFVKRCLY